MSKLEHHGSYTPTSGIGKWIDDRMPLPRLMYDSFVAYPVPRNLNYAYTFGGMLSIMLVVQILTGIVLAMHYAASSLRSHSTASNTSCATSIPAGSCATCTPTVRRSSSSPSTCT